MIKKLAIGIIILVLMSLSVILVSADTVPSVRLGGDVTKWILDEDAGYIYAIFLQSNKLAFINTSTMRIETERTFTSNINDIILEGNNLYVTLDSQKRIAVIDKTQRLVVKTITTLHNVDTIAIDGNRLFYLENDLFGGLYVYNLETGQETETGITGIYVSKMVVDKESHMLYIGEQLSDELLAVNANTYTLVADNKIWANVGSSSYWEGGLMLGDGVYYKGHKFNKSDIFKIDGEYKDDILYITGNYAVSVKAVYDRDKYVKITDIPNDFFMEFYSKVLMDSTGYCYLFDQSNWILSRKKLDLTFDTSMKHTRQGSSLVIDETIKDWVADENSGLIYAISYDSNKLLYIRASDMEVIKEQYIGSSPSDIDLYNGKLYIAASGTNRIEVVDTATGIVSSIPTTLMPYAVAVGEDKIFFLAAQDLYVYDLNDNKEEKIPGTFVPCSIAIHPEDHTLYVEQDLTDPNIHILRTSDYIWLKHVSHTVTTFPGRLTLDEDSIYVRGKRLSMEDANIIEGGYSDRILYARGNYVFSDKAVYDKEKYVKITDLPVVSDNILMDSENWVYLFDTANKTLRKEKLDLTLDLKMNHIKTDSGVILDEALTDWVYDSSSEYIYAISKDGNKLLYIRASDLEVIKELYLGGLLTDIALSGGKLYIAVNDSLKIAVIDPADDSITSIYSRYKPYMLAVDGEKIFYFGELSPSSQLRVYNMSSGIDASTGIRINKSIEIDPEKHILYANIPETIGTNVYAISTIDYLKLGKTTNTNGAGFPYPDIKVVLNEGYVYYSGRRFPAENLPLILGSYNDKIISVKGNSVFSNNAVYDRDSFAKRVSFNDTQDMILMDDAGIVYSYNNSDRKIQVVDSSEKDIKSFSVPQMADDSSIDHDAHTIDFHVPSGTNIAALNPGIVLSKYAVISPLANRDTNFTNPVKYTVTAMDGTTQEWTVKCIVDIEPVTIVGMNFSPPSPQTIGSDINILANARGGVTLQYAFEVHDGAGVADYRDYSEESEFKWTPAKAGDYSITLYVRDINSKNEYDAALTKQYRIKNPVLPVELNKVSVYPRSPQLVKRPITVTADAAGGEQLCYRYEISDGSEYRYMSEYSLSSQYEWRPAEAGKYTITVYVKDVNSTADFDRSEAIGYEVIEGIPVVLKAVMINPPSPQQVGDSITVTAEAEGGIELSYKFSIYEDGNLQIASGYAAEDTFTWEPEFEDDYIIEVCVKDRESENDYDARQWVRYKIEEATQGLIEIESFTATPEEPQFVGSEITLVAEANGGDDLYYCFSIYENGEATYISDYTKNNTYVWKPKKAGSYALSVFVRDADSGNEYDVVKRISYIVQAEEIASTIEITSFQALEKNIGLSGKAVALTAEASGGTDLYYMFRVFDGESWKVLKDFDRSNNFIWLPKRPGDYIFEVSVRDKANILSSIVRESIEYKVEIRDYIRR